MQFGQSLEGTDIINIGAHCHEPETLDGELKAFVEDEKSKGECWFDCEQMVKKL